MTGRAVLWCVVAVLLLRGAGDVLAAPEREPVRVAQRDAEPAWPDDEAKAFAVRFARAYLGYSPRHPSSELLAFVTPDVAGSLLPRYSRGDPRARVEDAVASRVERLDDGHALVTVAAITAAGTRHLTVPVARDAGGGLVVFDLPSFSAPPTQAHLEEQAHEPLTGADAAEVEDVLVRFFRAYLAGRSEELEYLVPAGVSIPALAEPLELAGIDSISELDTHAVLATVRARDPEAGATWSLRYRVVLVRGDRLYVAALNTTRKEG
jgi:hypothetical protein